MIFHAVRSYNFKNLFINRDIVCSRETRYRVHKKSSSTNIYLIRKNNAKRKKLRKF